MAIRAPDPNLWVKCAACGAGFARREILQRHLEAEAMRELKDGTPHMPRPHRDLLGKKR